jgi:hypothetical protein
MSKSVTKVHAPKQLPSVLVKNWKRGMWVVYQERTAILTKIEVPAEIHIVDMKTGETAEILGVPLEALRQARYPEIPPIRRLISAEDAKELGYGA